VAEEPTISDQAREDVAAIEGFIVDEPTDEVLRLHLDRFEGPFEVLLYLIKSQEIDIFDIPIVRITQQYLKFLDMMREENLDVAGEYLVMAATLIQIKSKMILPMDVPDDEEEEIEDDPRLELVEKLIEYRKYRDITRHLEEMEEERLNWFTRNVKPQIEADPEEEEYIEVTLYDLAQAFKNVARFLTKRDDHHVELENYSVDDKIDYIQQQLERADSVAWVDLFEGCSGRLELICCFLAILELCRMGKVRAHQHIRYGDIRLFKVPELRVA
jgi:segregation and condensation protein A